MNEAGKLIAAETQRLFLRPTNTEDAEFLLELMNSPKWIKNIGDRKVRTIQDSINYIESKIKSQQERLGFSNYTVIRKTDQAKIGTCGLYDREGLEGVDIGFAFLPQYEKMGYAYESASKMMELGIQHFGLKKISAITITENIDSQRLIEKLGLKFDKRIKLPNDEEELLLYSSEF
jgi:RimJ/RimL family protein N-acetyltransferase